MAGVDRENTNGYQRRDDRIQPLMYDKPLKPQSVDIKRGSEMAEYLPKKGDRVTIAIFKKPLGEEDTPLRLTDEVLLLQRHPNPYPENHPVGFTDWYAFEWELSGGGITQNSTPQEAALAEVVQETSLQTNPIIFGVIPPDQRGRHNWVFTSVVSNVLKIERCVEHIDDRWISIQDALRESLARDHEAILKQICLENGDKDLQEFFNN